MVDRVVSGRNFDPAVGANTGYALIHGEWSEEVVSCEIQAVARLLASIGATL